MFYMADANEYKIQNLSQVVIIFFNQRFNIVLWQKEGDSSYCENADTVVVTNQLACQRLCEAKKTCVGISYYGEYCRTCEDGPIPYVGSYYFYRRPG